MRIDGAVAVVDEESHLAKPSAPADVLVDVRRRARVAGALVGEVRACAVAHPLDRRDPLV